MHPILANRRKVFSSELPFTLESRKCLAGMFAVTRIPCTQAVLLAWTAEDGSDRYARGRCRDVSTAGLRIETFEAIPAQSLVSLRIETWDLAGSARVRYSRRVAPA